jgi:hypothetical protein
MRPLLIVEINVATDKTRKLLLMQDEEMIQAFTSHRTDESFTDGIRPWGFEWGFDFFDATASGHRRKLLAILLVIVANEIFGVLAPGCGLPKLLSRPGISWMAGNSHMLDFPSLMGNDDEDVNGTEKQVINNREITSPDILSMVLEKVRPILTRLSTNLLHVFLNGWLAYTDAQLEQFASDFLGAHQ